AIHRGHPASGVTLDAAVLLKRFAYGAGSAVLEAVIPYVIGGQDLWFDPPDLATPEGRLDQRVRLPVALEMVPQDTKTGWKPGQFFMGGLLRAGKTSST